MRSLARAIVLLVLLLPPVVKAADGSVGTIFIKNNGHSRADIWVNDAYQGYVPAGKCHYTVSDGFVTYDSGRPTPDGGVTPTKESHAGWDGSGPVVMKVRFWGEDGVRYTGQITLEGDVEKKAYVSVGETDPGLPPNDIEAEDAPAILKGVAGRPPDDWAGKFTGSLSMTGNDGATWDTNASFLFNPKIFDGPIQYTLGDDGTLQQATTAQKGSAMVFGMELANATEVYKIVPDEDGTSATLSAYGRYTGGDKQGGTYKGSASLALASGEVKAKALRTGDVQVTLTWTGAPDVDLYVTDPDGNTIYYQNRTAPNGGELDVDCTHGNGPESIFWPQGKAPKGEYKVAVNLFSGDEAHCRVRVMNGTTRKDYTVDLAGEKDTQDVVTFTNGDQ